MKDTVQLIGNALLVVYTFFGVVPMLMNTIAQFTVHKHFAEEMISLGVISEESVKTVLPKKQIAGVVISALLLFVLFGACIKTSPYGWLFAGIPAAVAVIKYRHVAEFNSFTVKRFQSNFKGEYNIKKLNEYIETHF